MNTNQKILNQSPECDKRCGLCLSTDKWVAVDYEETDYNTTIYTYECKSIDPELDVECGNTTKEEFENERIS